MALYDFQRALLRLYTEKSFLDAFLAAPSRTLAPYALTTREREALLTLPRDRLADFHRELREKRVHVAQKILRRAPPEGLVVISSFYQDQPVALWGVPPGDRRRPIPRGAYLLLHRLAEKQAPVSLRALVAVYPAVADRCPLRDLFLLAKALRRHRWVGARIRAL